MFTSSKSEKLLDQLQKADYEAFFKALQEQSEHPRLGSFIEEINEEWRKLLIAQKNKLMDDEQINLALIAFFRRKSKQMLTTLEEDEADD